MPTDQASVVQLLGAVGFGAVIGWYLYFLNRYRKDVVIGDVTVIVGAIGGAAILAIFPARSDLFGAYGIGIFAGFFAYFLWLAILVLISKNFGIDYLIDGRSRLPDGSIGWGPGVEPPPRGLQPIIGPQVTPPSPESR